MVTQLWGLAVDKLTLIGVFSEDTKLNIFFWFDFIYENPEMFHSQKIIISFSQVHLAYFGPKIMLLIVILTPLVKRET